MFTTKSIVAILSAASLTLAAPTATTPDTPNVVARAPAVTKSVTVKANPLSFTPDNIFAEVGEVVEFHFKALNHTVTLSFFAEPCVPLADGFNSDFVFVPALPPALQSDKVFQITVTDKKPIWFYCAQTNGNHCQKGMTGVINQNPDGPNNLRAHRELAAKAVTKAAVGVLAGKNEGKLIANSNPNGGFS